MAYTIAISGKGGTGKTTVAGLIINQLLVDKKVPVLAIDADPNSTLNEVLGVELGPTLGDIQAEILKERLNYPAGMDKNRYTEYQLQTCLVEEDRFDLLAMGRTEGPGCYCSINNILRSFIDRLTPNYRYVVMDNEAGMEHLSRRTTRNADLLLIVSDATPIAIRSAGRIYNMMRNLEISIGNSYLVMNHINEDLPESIATEVKRTGLELLGAIPHDEGLVEYSLNSKSVLSLPDNSPSKMAIRKLLDKAGT